MFYVTGMFHGSPLAVPVADPDEGAAVIRWLKHRNKGMDPDRAEGPGLRVHGLKLATKLPKGATLAPKLAALCCGLVWNDTGPHKAEVEAVAATVPASVAADVDRLNTMLAAGPAKPVEAPAIVPSAPVVAVAMPLAVNAAVPAWLKAISFSFEAPNVATHH